MRSFALRVCAKVLTSPQSLPNYRWPHVSAGRAATSSKRRAPQRRICHDPLIRDAEEPARGWAGSAASLGWSDGTLDAAKFQHCFMSWVASLTGAAAEVIAIDGKAVRRSFQKKGAKAPIHMVSAFAARQRLVLEEALAGGRAGVDRLQGHGHGHECEPVSVDMRTRLCRWG
jgi:hypothetical protein